MLSHGCRFPHMTPSRLAKSTALQSCCLEVTVQACLATEGSSEGGITRLVRMSLTPQLISKPTPPGDTTASGFPMSNAATFPMAKPYPECMSGSAIDFCKKRTSDDRCACTW